MCIVSNITCTLQARFKMDCYSYIKLINYIRTKKSNSMEITNCDTETPPWEDDVYMKPVLADDPWLMFGLYIC